MKSTNLILILNLAAIALAQDTSDERYDGLNTKYGMGKGTIWVLAAAIIGILFCLVRDISYYPNCMVCCGFLLPIFVLLLIFWLPKESLQTDTEQKTSLPTSWYFLKAIAFLILNIIIAISVCIMIICNKCRRISVQRFDTSLADGGEAFDDDSESEEDDIEE